MENNDILNKKNLMIVGPYGSGKTSFLATIYDFFMNLIPIDNIDIQNEEIKHLLNYIKFSEYEIIYFTASEDKNIVNLLYKNLNPLIQQINTNLSEQLDFQTIFESSFKLIINAIRKITPETTLLILIDDLEFYLMAENKNQKNSNLIFIQNLAEFIHYNNGLKLIIATQSEIDLPLKFRDRFYIVRI